MIYAINSKEWEYIQYTSIEDKKLDNREKLEIMMEEIEDKFYKKVKKVR